MQQELTQQLQKILKDTFHFDGFRPGQLETIECLIKQGRLLCIQPTGYGKSLLYQLPAVYLGGITLVVSPLLALMRDQITQLKTRFGITAASLNTDQSDMENQQAKRAAEQGNLRILFIAPEQLNDIEKFEFLKNLPIKLLVIDEAHCISTWGHDFRPSYREIIKLAYALAENNPTMKILGLTATADAKTEMDIKQQMSDGGDIVVHRESMNRPNIRLSVLHTFGISAKLATLSHLLKKLPGTGLIYCATRENTEVVALYLQEQGIKAAAYHAGLETTQKMQLQHDFLHDQYSVIAATNALGMGIDKSNLRYVIHFDFPGSITAYYQEVGRCGRDGNKAEGILLYDAADNKIQRYFIEASQPKTEDFENVLSIIAESMTGLPLSILKRQSGMHPTKLNVVLAELVEQGFIEKVLQNRSQLYKKTLKRGSADLSRYYTQFKVKATELTKMQNFAEQKKKCLMEILRFALGDKTTRPCGVCNICEKTAYTAIDDKAQIITISSWLNRRTVAITLYKKIKATSPGIAVLDGKLRSNDFVYFMRERMKNASLHNSVTEKLLQLIKDCVKDLSRHHKLGCIVSVPSTTWLARDAVMKFLSDYLKIPVVKDVLYWKKSPVARQGELLNNDQRKYNVALQMEGARANKVPRGTILLFDDYIGSGATMNEAARALRENAKLSNKIVPFAIAAVKWRVGYRGMI